MELVGRKTKSSWHEPECEMLGGQLADFIHMQQQVEDQRFRWWSIKDSGRWVSRGEEGRVGRYGTGWVQSTVDRVFKGEGWVMG